MAKTPAMFVGHPADAGAFYMETVLRGGALIVPDDDV
jgi:hypothetical protein